MEFEIPAVEHSPWKKLPCHGRACRNVINVYSVKVFWGKQLDAERGSKIWGVTYVNIAPKQIGQQEIYSLLGPKVAITSICCCHSRSSRPFNQPKRSREHELESFGPWPAWSCGDTGRGNSERQAVEILVYSWRIWRVANILQTKRSRNFSGFSSFFETKLAEEMLATCRIQTTQFLFSAIK